MHNTSQDICFNSYVSALLLSVRFHLTASNYILVAYKQPPEEKFDISIPYIA